jgi:protein involved in polysaccharide export with SLBB domain
MNRPLSAVLSLLAVAAPVLAQDPAFRPAEPPVRPAAPAPVSAPASIVRDDTSSAVAQMSSMDRLDSTYALGIGDRVSLRIVEDGEKVYSLKIQDSGNIQAPFISLVPAAGKTCKDVAFYMKRELEKQHFKQATVILALEEKAPVVQSRAAPAMVPGAFITIYGQVARQGRYEVDPQENLTVSQAILKAGGFSQFAQDKKVKVIRNVKGRNVDIIVNLKEVMTKGKLEYDIPIYGGDVIVVAEKLINL